MCLRNASELKTAKKDFVVFKVLKVICTPKQPEDEWVKYHGKSFTGVIAGITCEGKIYADGENVWFCTDDWNLDGSNSPDRLGYDYSYIMDSTIISIKVDDEELMEISRYQTPYRQSDIIPSSTVQSALVMTTYNRIGEGIHAYMSREGAEHDAGGKLDMIIVECTIPKGAEYYEGEFNHVASIAADTLIYPDFAG